MPINPDTVAIPAAQESLASWLFWGVMGLSLLYNGWNLKRTSNIIDDIEKRTNCHEKKLAILASVPEDVGEIYNRLGKVERDFAHLEGEHRMAFRGGHVHGREGDTDPSQPHPFLNPHTKEST